MTENTATTVPAGYRKNSRGHLVPEADVSPLDRQRDDLVHEIFVRAQILSKGMAESKKNWLSAIQAHLQLAAEKYQVTVGGGSGNVTLLSYDGLIKIERQHSRRLVVNERVAIAKELVERHVVSLSTELTGDTKRMVRAAFRMDEKGNYSATALLSIARRMKSEAPEWQAAVAAINDAVTTEYGDPYVRVYIRQDDGTYQQLSLDMSEV